MDCSKTDPGEALRSLGGAVLVVATAPSKEGMGELVKGLSVLGKLVVLSGMVSCLSCFLLFFVDRIYVLMIVVYCSSWAGGIRYCYHGK